MNPTSKERSPGVDLSALREALAKATPGPWTREKPGADENGWPSGVAVAGTPGRQTIYASPPGGCFPSADCDLIVLLRNTAPDLIAELEAARAEVARLRECVAINATKGAKVVNDLIDRIDALLAEAPREDAKAGALVEEVTAKLRLVGKVNVRVDGSVNIDNINGDIEALRDAVLAVARAVEARR